MFTMEKGKFLIDNTPQADVSDGITFICTFSRRIMVPFFFRAFNKMSMPRSKIHLIVYDNTDDTLLATALIEEVNKVRDKFLSVRLYKSYLPGKGNILGSGNEQFKASKLFNIWKMWLSMREMIKTDTFFVLEDDTIAPPDAFQRLYKLLLSHKGIGFATAIETGRTTYPWVPVRLGVHKSKMRGLKVIERRSFSPFTRGVKEIDCAGVYCFAARTKAYLSGFRGYDPINLKVPFFALDNVLTYNMKKHGWKLLADFGCWCSHLQASSARIIAFGKNQAVEMADLWIEKYHNYASGLEILPKNAKPRRYRVRRAAPSWELEPEIKEEKK